jgi:TorA maturation chaperone TorD
MTLTAEIAATLAEDVSTLAVLLDRELTPEALTALKGIEFPDNLALLPTDDASREAFRVMKEAVAALPPVPGSGPGFMDDLAADYAAIFLTGALGASPYESYWLSDDHLICQDAMWDVRTLYAAGGYKVPNWRLRPDDHLVHQLQFLSRQLTKARIDDDWRTLAGFLDYHLLRWLPDFASRVAYRCDTSLYAAFAILTDAWCQHLRNRIADHLGEARPSPEEIAEQLRRQKKTEAQEFPVRFVPGATGPSW